MHADITCTIVRPGAPGQRRKEEQVNQFYVEYVSSNKVPGRDFAALLCMIAAVAFTSHARHEFAQRGLEQGRSTDVGASR